MVSTTEHLPGLSCVVSTTEHLPGLSGVVLTFLLQPHYYPSWISVLFSSNNNCEYCHKSIIIPSYIGSPQTHVVLDSKFKAKIMLIPNFVGCLGLYSNHTHSCTQTHPLQRLVRHMVQLNPEDRFTVEEYLRIYKGNACPGGRGEGREWLGGTHQCTLCALDAAQCCS